MRDNLLRGRTAFLAYSFKLEYRSIIEGLNRRFPEAWQERERYNYYQHELFKQALIYDEYILNLIYCLFEKSNEHDELAKALFELMIKKEPKLYRLLKNKQKSCLLSVEELLDIIQFNFAQNLLTLEQCCKLSAIDFLCEQLNLEIEIEDLYLEFDEMIEESISQYLLEQEDGSSGHFLLLRKSLRKPNSDLNKVLKSMLRQYINYLGLSQNEFLSLEFLTSNHFLYPYGEQFLNTSIESRKLKLTQQEALDILCLLRCLQKDKEQDTLFTHEQLDNEDFEFFNKHLSQTVVHYLLSEQRKQDVECFFKHYVLADEITIRKLEQELEKLKVENEKIREELESFDQEKVELTCQYEKKYANKIKMLNADLLKANRMKNALVEENTKLKCENEKLFIQLNEQDELFLEIDLEPENLDEDLEFGVDLEALNDPSILIIGGAIATVQRLKEKLPNCKYYEVDQKYNDDYFTGINQAILLTNIINHGMTLKFDKLCPKVPKKSVKHTNVDLIIKEIAMQRESIIAK